LFVRVISKKFSTQMRVTDFLRTVLYYIKSTYYCYILFYIERYARKLLYALPQSFRPELKMLPESTLPLRKVHQNIEKCVKEEKEAGKRLYDKFYILITTGSLSPIHLMHTEMLELTRDHMDKQVPRSKVVGGYLSPCNDEYVSYKLPREYIPGKHRLEMCKLAVQDSDFIDVDAWEIKGNRLRMFSEVAIQLADYFKEGSYAKKYPLIAENLDRIRVCFVCGSDVMVTYRHYGLTFSKDVDVATVSRPKHEFPNVESRIKQHKKKGVDLFVVMGPDEDVSSTKVRQVISEALKCENNVEKTLRENLSEYCHKPVVEYLMKNVIKCGK
jgi:nicotinamide mononucleotide adenylyltransferase